MVQGSLTAGTNLGTGSDCGITHEAQHAQQQTHGCKADTWRTRSPRCGPSGVHAPQRPTLSATSRLNLFSLASRNGGPQLFFPLRSAAGLKKLGLRAHLTCCLPTQTQHRRLYEAVLATNTNRSLDSFDAVFCFTYLRSRCCEHGRVGAGGRAQVARQGLLREHRKPQAHSRAHGRPVRVCTSTSRIRASRHMC